ncbi:unnamed protein product [Cuscuta campestris]|uniref:Uncharacterized protein n=1 Tax=Cuscuta campestris TaxID=132261 RepID=A0A484MA26_9ASTE|nr:unnamed protein product [Cuscuta campestris]
MGGKNLRESQRVKQRLDCYLRSSDGGGRWRRRHPVAATVAAAAPAGYGRLSPTPFKLQLLQFHLLQQLVTLYVISSISSPISL